jgi:hypothetical protein
MLGDRSEFGFRVTFVVEAILLERAVIPMVTENELSKLEGITEVGGVDGAEPTIVEDTERFAVSTAANLHLATAADEIVAERIERVQKTNPAIGFRVDDQQVSVVDGLHIHADAIACLYDIALVGPDADRGFLLERHRGGCISRRESHSGEQ